MTIAAESFAFSTYSCALRTITFTSTRLCSTCVLGCWFAMATNYFKNFIQGWYPKETNRLIIMENVTGSEKFDGSKLLKLYF